MKNSNRRDARLEKFSLEMRRAYDASEEGDKAKALEIYEGVLERVQGMGLTSGFLLWNLAIVADNLGELEKAFDYVRRALATDPLAQPFLNSFDIVVKRIRAELADTARPVDDPSTPRLYDILAGAGEADVPSHVAMARWCVTAGDVARAGKLAEALVTLFPGEPLAWLCKAEVARASGDAAMADECLAEAAVRGSTPAPFAVPGIAQG